MTKYTPFAQVTDNGTSDWIEFEQATGHYLFTTDGDLDGSGVVNIIDGVAPFLIVPANHDVRVVGVADASGRDGTAGLNGFLAKILT